MPCSSGQVTDCPSPRVITFSPITRCSAASSATSNRNTAYAVVAGDKDYFILTSNADTHLELSGFAPGKVFEVEGTFEDMLHNRPMQDKSQEANAFLNRYHGKRLAILELGIGSRNRLIKLPLMQLAAREPQAVYITLNLAQELYIPNEIAHKSIGLAGDIAVTLQKLKEKLV